MRLGDVFHPDFEQGLPTYFDMTVRNSLQPLYIPQAAQLAGVAAEAGEKEDCRHEGLVTATGSVSHPRWTLVTTQLESHHDSKKISFPWQPLIQQATINLHEKLSVKLWLYNAKTLLHRWSLDCRESALLDL